MSTKVPIETQHRQNMDRGNIKVEGDDVEIVYKQEDTYSSANETAVTKTIIYTEQDVNLDGILDIKIEGATLLKQEPDDSATRLNRKQGHLDQSINVDIDETLDQTQPKRSRLAKTYDDSDGKSQNDEEDKQGASVIGDTLNDFCWLKIVDQLNIEDLCNVVDVNQQIKRVSIISFSKRYENETFGFPYSVFGFGKPCEYLMRRVLCKFGRLIKSMSLKDRGFIYEVEIESVSRFCAGTLQKLHLAINAPIDPNLIDLVQPLFASLKALFIMGDCINEFINDCAELKVLKTNFDNHSTFIRNLPNLVELHIVSDSNVQTVTTLLQLNTQLKKLIMYDSNANKSICAVASQMEELEELILQRKLNDYDNIGELGKIRSLKVLEVHGTFAMDAMENIPLERLKLLDCSGIEFVMDSILKLSALKCLSLATIFLPFDNWLLKLAEKLPLLEELELGFLDPLKKLFSFGCLKRLIKRLPNLNSLVIHSTRSDLFDEIDGYRQLRSRHGFSRMDCDSLTDIMSKESVYDSFVKIIRKRSNAKKFKLTINGRDCKCLLHVEFL